MASTFSDLKIQLMATGENSGTWGDVTNVNLGTAIEEAITGSASVAFSSADVTLPFINTNETQAARNLRLNLTGTSGGARNLIVPAIEKVYIINNGLADTVTVKNAAGTGIAVPTGKTMYVYNNGTNVVDAITHLTSLTTGVLTSTSTTVLNGTTIPASKTLVDTDSTQTLTNKGINLANNTLTATSAQIAAAVSDETGSGALVFANSPTLVTPALGTPASGVVTNLTGTASININGTVGASTPSTVASTNLSYTGTLTGGTGVINIGSGQVVKDASGNVGIGTSSPGSKLAVLGSDGTGFTGITSVNSNVNIGIAGVQFGSDPTYVKSAIGLVRSNVNGVGSLVFYNDSNTDAANWSTADEKMRITSTGNVGIGTSSPVGKVQINAPTGTAFPGSIALAIRDSSAPDNGFNFNLEGVSTGDLSLTRTLSGTSTAVMTFARANGNVGIGTSSPDQTLSVHGTNNTFLSKTTGGAATNFPGAFWHAATSGDNQFVMFATEGSFTVRGSITFNRASGLTAFNTTSDRRAKDILGEVTDSGNVIDQLKVYNGLMKGATVARPMLIADEAQEVTPYAVTGEKNAVDADAKPIFQQMDVSSYVPLLIAELQSLRKRVAELESQINSGV